MSKPRIRIRVLLDLFERLKGHYSLAFFGEERLAKLARNRDPAVFIRGILYDRSSVLSLSVLHPAISDNYAFRQWHTTSAIFFGIDTIFIFVRHDSLVIARI
jgi:hypothetical protein